MKVRQVTLKTVLWLFVGIWVTVSLARFIRGLGATTGLSDVTPWGLWIAFDVMTGVALAAGGFVIAATVYIFGLERYRPFARPAILTAFLGYVAVAVGLLYDIGVPLHIWHPMVYHQPRSVLFEVAMCVILYLTVLFLEFCPVILEHSWFNRPLFQKIHKFLKGVTIPLVVTGIVLSTLHQSSLGSLFLIAPYRVHPLWYSHIIWILFFVSAIGLGLMMVAAESMFSSWYFGHRLRMDLLSSLGRTASVVLFIYAVLRLGDLALRGQLVRAFDGSWQSVVFQLEMLLAVLVPAVLLAFHRVRSNPVGLGTCAAMTILGVMGYRFNLCIVAFTRPKGTAYFPSWMEMSVTLGIVAAAILAFLFFVENFQVCQSDHEEKAESGQGAWRNAHPLTMSSLLPESLAGPRRYSLAAVAGIAIALAFLPSDIWTGEQLERTPVFSPRVMEGYMRALPASYHDVGYDWTLRRKGNSQPEGSAPARLFLLDGNRNGRLVLFNHDFHRNQLGGDASCVQCHHQALPFDTNTACTQCHRDMYIETDMFDHSSHVTKLGDNQSCSQCHQNANEIKSRDTARPCKGCHEDMAVETAFVPLSNGGQHGLAAGYMDAMHGLCVECHRQRQEGRPQEYRADFANCSTCHRDVDGALLRRMGPYTHDEPET
jgi:Ni/Fe-hydrogenase subunit HybB-like protein